MKYFYNRLLTLKIHVYIAVTLAKTKLKILLSSFSVLNSYLFSNVIVRETLGCNRNISLYIQALFKPYVQAKVLKQTSFRILNNFLQFVAFVMGIVHDAPQKRPFS
jgi:hypothetical protein